MDKGADFWLVKLWCLVESFYVLCRPHVRVQTTPYAVFCKRKTASLPMQLKMGVLVCLRKTWVLAPFRFVQAISSSYTSLKIGSEGSYNLVGTSLRGSLPLWIPLALPFQPVRRWRTTNSSILSRQCARATTWGRGVWDNRVSHGIGKFITWPPSPLSNQVPCTSEAIQIAVLEWWLRHLSIWCESAVGPSRRLMALLSPLS